MGVESTEGVGILQPESARGDVFEDKEGGGEHHRLLGHTAVGDQRSSVSENAGQGARRGSSDAI